MRDKKPSIFIVEDEKTQRLGLQDMLEKRGFYVEGAESIRDGRKILSEKGNEFDVFLIDMRLQYYPDFDENIAVTGADLIFEFFRNKANDKNFQKPEPIILSAFKEVDFLYKAVNLGAVAYLDKAIYNSKSVIQHLRALAVKRILSYNIGLVDTIEDIVTNSSDEADLYENLCSNILADVFTKCLGNRFVLFLTEHRTAFHLRAKNCKNCKNDFPVGEDPIYEEILTRMYSQFDLSKPFVLDETTYSSLSKKKSNISKTEIEKFKNSSFITLPLAGNFRLSIGILNDTDAYSDPPEEIAKLILSHVNPAAIRFISEIMARWHKNVAERDTTIKKLATFCSNVGREQLYILEDAKLRNEGSEVLDFQSHYEMKSLAEDLYQTGRILEPLSEKVLSNKGLNSYSANEIINDAKKEFIGDLTEQNNLSISIDGNCSVQCEREEVFLIAFRFFTWFDRRKFEVPEGESYGVKVKCSETDNESIITFEDNSYRVPKELREKMFNPFSPVAPPPSQDIRQNHKPGLYLSLYLSQIIVEEKYRGKIYELSDELDGETGHKIEMRIPLNK